MGRRKRGSWCGAHDRTAKPDRATQRHMVAAEGTPSLLASSSTHLGAIRRRINPSRPRRARLVTSA